MTETLKLSGKVMDAVIKDIRSIKAAALSVRDKPGKVAIPECLTGDVTVMVGRQSKKFIYTGHIRKGDLMFFVQVALTGDTLDIHAEYFHINDAWGNRSELPRVTLRHIEV